MKQDHITVNGASNRKGGFKLTFFKRTIRKFVFSFPTLAAAPIPKEKTRSSASGYGIYPYNCVVASFQSEIGRNAIGKHMLRVTG
ncbi:MAG: hypothetical protein ACYC7D_15540 [Nitrososphaerales archaeon]